MTMPSPLPPPAPVLAYNRVVTKPQLGWSWVGLARFRAQIDELIRAGYHFLTLSRYHDQMQGRPLPEEARPILLTFDEAVIEFADLVLPILEDRGIPCTLFALTSQVGRIERTGSRMGGRSRKHRLGWQDLRELSQRGVSVQSRGHIRTDLRQLPAEISFGDLLRSRREIERHIEHEANAVAYGDGRVNAQVEELARRAGFEMGFTLRSRASGSALQLPRIRVRCTDGVAGLRARVDRFYDSFSSW